MMRPRIPYAVAFPVAFDTPNLENGAPMFTAPAGARLAELVVTCTVAFNGTTPKLDVFADLNGQGLLVGALGNAANVSAADAALGTTGLLQARNYALDYAGFVVLVPTPAPVLFVVVSQDGTPGGGAIGGTAGLATVSATFVTNG